MLYATCHGKVVKSGNLRDTETPAERKPNLLRPYTRLFPISGGDHIFIRGRVSGKNRGFSRALSLHVVIAYNLGSHSGTNVDNKLL